LDRIGERPEMRRNGSPKCGGGRGSSENEFAAAGDLIAVTRPPPWSGRPVNSTPLASNSATVADVVG